LGIRRSKQSQDVIFLAESGQTLHQQFLFRAQLTPFAEWEADATYRLIGSIPSFQVGGYGELDLRLAYRPTKRLELSVVGQNLVHDHHLEFTSNLVDTERTEIDRGVYGKVTWNY